METLGVGEEKINSAEISAAELAQASAAFTTDFRAAKTEANFYSENKIDWKTLAVKFQSARSNALANCKNENLRRPLETAYNCFVVLTDQERITNFRDQLKLSQDENEKRELKSKIFELSLRLAKWQAQCFEMIKTFESIEGGKKLIANVWAQMEHIGSERKSIGFVGDREARGIKNGVLALRNSYDSLNYVCHGKAKIKLPTPEQDVEEQTDIIAETENGLTLAGQIKSHHAGVGNINCEQITGRKPTYQLSPKEADKVEQQNKFWNKISKKQAQGFNISALWIDVDGQEPEYIDQVTGEPAIKYLEMLDKGMFGETVRRTLAIEDNQQEEVVPLRQAA